MRHGRRRAAATVVAPPPSALEPRASTRVRLVARNAARVSLSPDEV
jgi:hypothetical protein